MRIQSGPELHTEIYKHRLYIPGWNLKEIVDTYVDYKSKTTPHKYDVFIAYDENDCPVGCCFLYGFSEDGISQENCVSIMFFVRKKHRRKGIASQLYKSVQNKYPKINTFLAGEGKKKVSLKFFESLTNLEII